MAIDVPTLLASAGLSLMVSVTGAGVVVARQARANRALEARSKIRAAVRPLQQEATLWARQGLTERVAEAPAAPDPEAVTKVLEVLPDLPWWRRRLVRRRMARLFGSMWPDYLQLWPWDSAHEISSLQHAQAYEHRAGGPDGEGVLLTEGLVHQTLVRTEFGGRPGERLDRELRRLAAAW